MGKSSTLNSKCPAILISAFNEEKVISDTLLTIISSGFRKENVFIVSDGSVDKTYEIAKKILGRNAVKVKNSGKFNALKFGFNYFKLKQRYKWVLISDADTIIDKFGYRNLRRSINQNSKKDVICGQVKTIRRNWISDFRAYEYAIGQDLFKSIESRLSAILITPGCSTIYKSEILGILFNELGYINNTMVEDFDTSLILQKQLKCKIIYDSSIVMFTQEPETIEAYVTQTIRWYRGWFQVIKKNMPFSFSSLDMFMIYFTLSPAVYFFEALYVIISSIYTRNLYILDLAIIFDLIMIFIVTIYVSIKKSRKLLISILPIIFLMQFFNLALFIKAGIEVLILRKFPLKMNPVWDSTRY